MCILNLLPKNSEKSIKKKQQMLAILPQKYSKFAASLQQICRIIHIVEIFITANLPHFCRKFAIFAQKYSKFSAIMPQN